MAETTPPSGGADTFAPTQQSTKPDTEPKETFILAEDTALRPFSFRATDEQLADLKRRIKATDGQSAN